MHIPSGQHQLEIYSNEDLENMLYHTILTPYTMPHEKSAELLYIIEGVRDSRQSGLLSYVLSAFGKVRMNSGPVVGHRVSKKANQYVRRSYHEVRSVFHDSVMDNPTPDELARRLLAYLKKRFPHRAQRAVALSYMLGDPRVPYQQLDAELSAWPMDDGDVIEVGPNEPGVLLADMEKDQLILFHAFHRMGPSK